MMNRNARFFSPDHENIYQLFDAFLQKTIIEDKVINFSKDPVQNPDGTFELATVDLKFSDVLARRAPEPQTTLHNHLKWLLELGSKELFWGSRYAAKANTGNTELLSAILTRFVTWPRRPVFKNADEVKESLVPFVFKTSPTDNAGARHQLLHLCDPDHYMRAVNVNDKMLFIARNRHFLHDFKQPTPQFYENSQLYYRCKRPTSKKLDDSWDTDYLNNWTEDQICYIHDQMNKTAKEA